MQRLNNKIDDDNLSAHFSQHHSNYTDRDSERSAFTKPNKPNIIVEYELRNQLEESERSRR